MEEKTLLRTVKEINIAGVKIGGNNPLVLVAGPCVIEREDQTLRTAERLFHIARQLEFPLIFKASYDKANRASINSFRGPGLKKGIEILSKVKRELGIPLLSDVHCKTEVKEASEVLDVIQIPAFLCRQTDLVLEAAKTNKVLNIKKGQFLTPWDMRNVILKVESVGNDQIMLTERGTSFGYNNLIVDMRSIKIMRDMGYPVIFDATHSVQLPGRGGTESSGEREFVIFLARASVAVGIDGIFMEVHENPDLALCDGPNSISLDQLPELLGQLKRLDDVVRG